MKGKEREGKKKKAEQINASRRDKENKTPTDRIKEETYRRKKTYSLIMEPLLELIANAFFIIETDCQWLPKGRQRCQTLCREQEEGRTLPPCLAYLFLYADTVSGNQLIFRLSLGSVLRKTVEMQTQDTCPMSLGLSPLVSRPTP